MPKYYEFKIAGYYLYFTSHCIIECMHVHASDRKHCCSLMAEYKKSKPERKHSCRYQMGEGNMCCGDWWRLSCSCPFRFLDTFI